MDEGTCGASATSATAADATMSDDELIQRSSSWTLACDNVLLNRLKAFSDKISTESKDILQDCDNLSTDIDLLNAKVQTVTNQLLILSNTQFTENRVEEFQEMLSSDTSATKAGPVKTKSEKEAELIGKMKEAIQIGVSVKAEQERKRDNVNEPTSPNSISLKLPYIIGTPKFFSSRYCGLVDEMKLQPAPSHEGEEISPNHSNPPEAYVTQPEREPSSFIQVQPKTRHQSPRDDLFFQSERELYQPPSLSQSLEREGSRSSDESFQGTTSSTATSASNIEKLYGSNASPTMEKKRNPIIEEINNRSHARGMVPPPILIVNESEDSEDDFRPPPPGKGIRSALFEDEDDEDIFGDKSLFRSKQVEEENDDLFFDKPKAEPIRSIFSSNNFPTPILFPTEPPLMSSEATSHRNTTPPSPDPTPRQRSVSFEGTADIARNPDLDKLSEAMNQGLKPNPPVKVNPPVLSSAKRESPIIVSAEEHGKVGESLFTQNSNPTEICPELVPKKGIDEGKAVPPIKNTGKGFVRSMALGLKIVPFGLNPSAKSPLWSSEGIEPSSEKSLPVSATLPTTPEESVVNIPENAISSSVSSHEPRMKLNVSTPSAEGQLKNTPSSGQHHGKLNFVKSMAAGLKIDPMSLTPGVRPPSFHRSSSVSAEEEILSAEDDKNRVTTTAKPNSNLIQRNEIPPTVEQEFKPTKAVNSLPSTAVAKVLPSPGIGVLPSNVTSTSKSIFDDEEELSDDDLFKPKSLTNVSSDKRAGPQTSASKPIREQMVSSSKSGVLTNASADVSTKTLPAQSLPQKKHSKVVVKNSVFADSDSDDELFKPNSIGKSINSSKKSSALFVDNDDADDIFSGIFSSKDKPTPAKLVEREFPSSQKSEPPVEAFSTGLQTKHSGRSKQPSTPSLLQSETTASDNVPESVSKTSEKLKPPAKISSSKNLKVQSIFGDSDSDDDLFKPTSSTTARKPSARLSKASYDSEDEDNSLFISSTKKNSTTHHAQTKNLPKTLDKKTKREDNLLNATSVVSKTEEFHQSAFVPEKNAKSVVKAIVHGLKINPLALTPGAKPPILTNSEPVSVVPEKVNAIEGSPFQNEEKSVLFEDSLSVSSADLLPSVVKSRPRIPSARRPPTKKSILTVQEESIIDNAGLNLEVPISITITPTVVGEPEEFPTISDPLSGTDDEREFALPILDISDSD